MTRAMMAIVRVFMKSSPGLDQDLPKQHPRWAHPTPLGGGLSARSPSGRSSPGRAGATGHALDLVPQRARSTPLLLSRGARASRSRTRGRPSTPRSTGRVPRVSGSGGIRRKSQDNTRPPHTPTSPPEPEHPAGHAPPPTPHNDKRTARQRAIRSQRNRRRPTLPGPCGPSTIGAEGLNCSVRNGKRCFPLAIATGKR